MTRNAFFLFAFILISKSALHAQPNNHAAYWLRYQNQLNFSSKISWTNEIDNRRFITPDYENQFIFHSRFHYKKGRWDYGTGLTLSWSYTTIPEKPISHATMEARPVIEASYEIPFKSFFLQQRLRIDNRFFEADKLETIFDGTTYVMRFRYRVQARIPLKYDHNNKPSVNLRIANEIMLNDRKNTFDQNRIYASVDFAITKNLSIETGYIFIYQQRLGTDLFLERNVLRLSLLHRLFLFKTD
jgi:hypothetical protein